MALLTNRDVLAGLAFAAVGAAFAMVASMNYEFGTAVEMGPGYFPFGLGLLLTLLGLAILVRGVVRDDAGSTVETVNLRVFLVVLAAVGIFAILIELAGLVVAIIALVILARYAAGPLRAVNTLVTAIVLAGFCVLIFVILLRLQIPVWGTLLDGR